jgi:multiple sugar transport system substrate-binding protein
MSTDHRRTRRQRRRRILGTAGAAVLLGSVLAACGDSSSGGPVTLTFYDNSDSATAQQAVVDRCSQESGGKYRIEYVKLPKAADDQRQQMVRRLAAKDSSLDILGLDVTWEAEFAEAGWIRDWPDDLRKQVEDGALAGPLKTATYKGRLVAVPFNSNTQLLWYRSDLVPTPPTTWDEMIQMSEKLKDEGKPHYIAVQGAQYEGLTVWFNTLVASAGGSLLNAEGTGPGLGDPAKKALEIMRKVATSSAADPSLSNANEGAGLLLMESGQAAFEINYPFVWPSMQTNKPTVDGVDLQSVFKYAPYPRVDASEPAHVTIGGIDLAISSYSKHTDLAFQAALCLRNEKSQQTLANEGGLPPVGQALYQNPPTDFAKTYPFYKLISDQLESAAVRPLTPAYQSISSITSYLLSPPASIDPVATEQKLRDQLTTTLKSQGVIP